MSYAAKIKVIEQAERISNLIDLLRQHRCNSDGAMTVGECVDRDRCRCSCGLYLTARPAAPADRTEG